VNLEGLAPRQPKRRRCLRGLACAAAALLLLACASVPPPVETGQLFLWEVARSDGRGGRAHVMGSIHLSDDEIDFDPAVEQALSRAETLVLEVAPDELDPARMLELTTKTGFFEDGRTLESVLAPETWRLLNDRIERDRLAPEAFRHMEPWFAGITLQVIALEMRGFDAERGVDMSLARSAAIAGKAIIGLETAAAQLAALDSLPLATQELMLRGILESEDDDEAGFTLLLDAWRKGDAARIEAEVFAGLEDHPDLAPFFEAIYFERNRRMASDVAGIVDAGGRSFVIVGAAHVVGRLGVPALLASRGYSVRRLPKTPR
jgi:uncharacterized protein YbaP (TraB family)